MDLRSPQGSIADAERLAHVFSKRAEQLQKIQLRNILRFGARARARPRFESDTVHNTARLLALACAGAGKSMTFARSAPEQWSRGKLWKNMEFLFALPLRQKAVSSAQNLVELLDLNDLGITNTKEQSFIATYIMRHLKRVCLVLDGMDEVKLQQCSSFVRDILKGQKLRAVNLIVTSRPSSEVLNLDQRYPFTRRVELVGF